LSENLGFSKLVWELNCSPLLLSETVSTLELTSFITNETTKKVSTVEIISKQETYIPSDCANEKISDSIFSAADGKYSRISGRKLHKTAPSSKEMILQ
jgi:hypothetical protein